MSSSLRISSHEVVHRQKSRLVHGIHTARNNECRGKHKQTPIEISTEPSIKPAQKPFPPPSSLRLSDHRTVVVSSISLFRGFHVRRHHTVVAIRIREAGRRIVSTGLATRCLPGIIPTTRSWSVLILTSLGLCLKPVNLCSSNLGCSGKTNLAVLR